MNSFNIKSKIPLSLGEFKDEIELLPIDTAIIIENNNYSEGYIMELDYDSCKKILIIRQ